jgi:acetylornithine deacetylase/succinyl-diaminopimelate desuccinylase-like protein
MPLVVLNLALAASGSAAETPSWEDRAVSLLQEYLRIDTTAPPGNELRAARFYQKVLEAEGIPVEIDEFAPGRANLLAVLRGSGPDRPLILMNHMDVVAADATRWSVPPFSGLLKDGMIHGRGAEDMKTEGILQLLALVRLHREKVPLRRDVIFLATADEEVDFAGALRALSAQGWRDRLAQAEFLITEGGENILEPSGRVKFFGVGTGEKGAFWMSLKTTGTPGHGSRPIKDSALNRLIRALDRIRQHETPMKVIPSVARFFRDQAPAQSEPRRTWYADVAKALQDPVARRTVYDDREVSSLLRNTISITQVNAGYQTNVIPGTAEARLDVRLLPGEDPQAFLAELRRVIDDPSVDVVPDADFRPPNESPADSELFQTFERVIGRHFPGVPVTTRLLSGATESVLFRALGIKAYGMTPLVTTAEELATGHGDDERINEATVRRSTGVFYEVVREVVAR